MNKLIILLGLLFLTSIVFSDGFINGNFSDGFNNWSYDCSGCYGSHIITDNVIDIFSGLYGQNPVWERIYQNVTISQNNCYINFSYKCISNVLGNRCFLSDESSTLIAIDPVNNAYSGDYNSDSGFYDASVIVNNFSQTFYFLSHIGNTHFIVTNVSLNCGITTTTTSTTTTSIPDNHKETLLVFTELIKGYETPLFNITSFEYYEDDDMKYQYLYGNNYTYGSGVYTSNYDLINNNSLYIYSTNTFNTAKVYSYKFKYKCENGDFSCTTEYSDLLNYNSVLVEQYFIYSTITENDTNTISGYTFDNNGMILKYVNVKFDNIYNSYNSVSDDNGFFNISIVKNGEYRIKGILEGYKDNGYYVNIQNNLSYNLTLYPIVHKNFIRGYVKDCKTTDVIPQMKVFFDKINGSSFQAITDNNGYYAIYLNSSVYKVYTLNSIFPKEIHYEDIPLQSDYTLNLCTFRSVYLNKINFHIVKSDNSSYTGLCKIFNANESYLSTINLVNGLSSSYLINNIYYLICKYDAYSEYKVKSFTSDFDNQNIYIKLENTTYDNANDDPNNQNPSGNFTQKDFINFANQLWALLALLLLLFVFSLFSRI